MKPHQNKAVEKSFLISLGLTSFTFLFELIGGILSGSLALISDSAHVFLDVFALGISYFALRISSRPPDDRHSFGFHRIEVLAALVNGITLMLISIGIFYESWQRWLNPTEIKPLSMLWVAVLGLGINLLVARLLHKHEEPNQAKNNPSAHVHSTGESISSNRKDLNIHSAYLHVIGDAISSVGVILAAALIYFTSWTWVDPLMSVIIGIIILVGSFRVLRSSIHILVEGVPEGISVREVLHTLKSIKGVRDVHDLHIWNICSGHVALSAHITVDEEHDWKQDDIILTANRELIDHFQINHTTIQLETTPCAQPSC